MTAKELIAARYVAAVVAGNGDARRVANTLSVRLTADERHTLARLARTALKDLNGAS